MKQPRASSQWKLPLWVSTRLRGALIGEEVENPGEQTCVVDGEDVSATAQRGKREQVKRFL